MLRLRSGLFSHFSLPSSPSSARPIQPDFWRFFRPEDIHCLHICPCLNLGFFPDKLSSSDLRLPVSRPLGSEITSGAFLLFVRPTHCVGITHLKLGLLSGIQACETSRSLRSIQIYPCISREIAPPRLASQATVAIRIPRQRRVLPLNIPSSCLTDETLWLHHTT